MKIEPLTLLINENFIFNKNFYFVSGNEITLMQKIVKKIIDSFQKKEGAQLKRIDSIHDFVDEESLFVNKKIYFIKNYKGINKENLDKIKETNNIFIFFCENSQKIKKIKSIFIRDKDKYLIDCYELDKELKTKLLNSFIASNKLSLDKKLYWFLIEKLDSKYIFFENTLNKISSLEEKDITQKNITKILSISDSGREKVFFYLLKNNKEIINFYREKIKFQSDVNEFYYNCKFFCQLIIDSKNEAEYSKNIPIYLFRERGFLLDVYRKYSLKKKKLLLNLLFSTEKVLRNQSGLSLISGLRFFLSFKRITIS